MSRPVRRPKPWTLELVAGKFMNSRNKIPYDPAAQKELDHCLQWLLDEARRERRRTERKRKGKTC